MLADGSINELLRQRIIFTGRNLRSQKAPTQLGFNDAALMVAHASSCEDITPISGEHIAKFLHGNDVAPMDSRSMSVEVATAYLARLREEGLVEGYGSNGSSYSMSQGFARLLQSDAEAIKSPNVQEILFRGFDIFMHPEKARNCGYHSHRKSFDPDRGHGYVDRRPTSLRYSFW